MSRKRAPNLFSIIRSYRAMSAEIQEHLRKHPHDFSRFQDVFNAAVEDISVKLLTYELQNIAADESGVYRFQKVFRQRYRNEFMFGDCTRHTYRKPYGYAGDFWIIDAIYRNQAKTSGFDGLWDTYYLQMTACRATRSRKDELKKVILQTLRENPRQEVRIMDLASGPCRGIRELLDTDEEGLLLRAVFDCYDLDPHAIAYAQRLLKGAENVNLIQKNAIRLALHKDIEREVPMQYDLIYSAGLFDYLDARVAARLIANLYKLLKKGGRMVIANFGEKKRNSSAGLMEWVTEWYLIYRSLPEFERIFSDAGFSEKEFSVQASSDDVILYAEMKK